MKLKGKTAIITGSSMGIGKAIAYRLANEGANVVVNGRNEEKLLATTAFLRNLGFEASAFQGDMTDTETCKKMVDFTLEQYGGIDILVNNVGVGARGFIENTNPEVFKYIINSNVLGAVYPTLEAMPHIKASKGSVIFISSLAGFRGMPNFGPYGMSKMALTSLAESLRVETAKDGVHVGIVYVGMTKNDPEKRVLHADGSWKNLELHDGLFVDSPDDSARAVLDVLHNRSFKKIVSVKGKVYYWLQMLAPWFVDFTFRHKIETIEEVQK
jgi:NAD(P)-dependent dehydrogenase (short-subunit alcohol dehydrogenase family)